MFIEYPKHVYLDGNVENESRHVGNAEQEALEAQNGFAAIPSVQPADGAQPAGPAHLEFPKHLYKGDGDERETKRVENAEQEADERANGFVPFGESAFANASEPPADAPPKPAKAPKPAKKK